MREIKWRVRDFWTGEWSYYKATDLEGADNGGLNWNINSISEFTGLKDKNGKEIYEGDIINITVEYVDKTFASEKVKEWAKMPSGDIVVKVQDGESLWFNSHGQHPFNSHGQHPKSKLVIGRVIGNIWENGELLNDSK